MRYRLVVGLALVTVSLWSAGCSKTDTVSQPGPKQAGKGISDKTTLLATIGEGEKPLSVMPSSDGAAHAQLEAVFQPIFSQLGGGVAYSAERGSKAYVVHNGKPGKEYAAVGSIALSPDGRRFAYGARLGGTWHMVVDGTEGAPFSAVKSPVFSADGAHVAYQAMAGEKWYLVVDSTRNPGTDTRILDHAFSGDSSRIAYIDNVGGKNSGRLVISDLGFTKPVVVAENVSRMVVNDGGTKLLAISGTDSMVAVAECEFGSPGSVRPGVKYERIPFLAFGVDDISPVYVGERGGKRYLVHAGKEEPLPEGAEVTEPPVLASGKGYGAIMSAASTFFVFTNGKKQKEYEEAANLVINRDGSSYAYAARKGNSWVVVVNDAEGPPFDRVVNPVFSADGKRVLYRARKAGRRFVVLADRTAGTIATYPEYEQVFQVKLSGDGRSIGYGVKDGNKLMWKVERL